MSDTSPTDWVESSDIGTSYAKQNGNAAEDWALAEYSLEPRDESICPEAAHDVVDPRTNTPIEVKSCQVYDGRGQRGRFQVWDYAHDILADHGGGYIFVVHDPSASMFRPLLHRPLSCADVAALIGNWHDIDHQLRPDDARRTDIYQSDVFSDISVDLEAIDEAGEADIQTEDPTDSQHQRVQVVKDTIRKLEDQNGVAPHGPLMAALDAKGIEESEAEATLDDLLKKGEAYQPKTDAYRVV